MNNIMTIVMKEMQVFFRDRRTVFLTFVFPFILYPLMFKMIAFMKDRNKDVLQKSTHTVLITENVPQAFIDTAESDPNLKFVKDMEGDPKALLENRKIQVFVDFADALTVKYMSSEKESNEARRKIMDYAEQYRQSVVLKSVTEAGLDETVLKPFEIIREDTSSKERMGGMILGRILPYMIMIMMFAGVMQFGLECTTGEKEKGTIATLLVSQASRFQIVAGKLLYIITIELMYAIANIGAFAFAGKLAFGKKATEAAVVAAQKAPEISFSVDPIAGLLLLILVIPIVLTASSLIMTIGSYAKSMKEGQTMFTPALMAFIMIGIMSLTAPLKVPEYYFYIPMVNTSFVMQEILTFKFNMVHFLWTLATTFGLSAFLIWLTIWFFNRESIHFRN